MAKKSEGKEARQDARKDKADTEKNPSEPFPHISEPRRLREEVGHIRSTIGDVGNDGQKEEDKDKVNGEQSSGFGITSEEVTSDDNPQHPVVN